MGGPVWLCARAIHKSFRVTESRLLCPTLTNCQTHNQVSCFAFATCEKAAR
jgi:hypothetical protein